MDVLVSRLELLVASPPLGSVVFLEGDLGSGKTHVLRKLRDHSLSKRTVVACSDCDSTQRGVRWMRPVI